MKRFHVHLHVEDLARSIAFYEKLFGAAPTRVEHDYAKWMLEDPRVNFAISSRGAKPGLDHLGLQVESDEELAQLRAQVGSAEIAAFDQAQAACCYAKSDKYWINDPQGIAWETFHTLDQIPVFGADTQIAGRDEVKAACCAPAAVAPVQFTEWAKTSRCC
jgi:catechol 2,3-dioxygenase-like lactoylglutathione lyase family enzyme